MIIQTNHRGVTLIELLVAVTMAVFVVTAMSTLFPKASKSISANRQRIVATQLAQTLMQQTKNSPYPLLYPSPEVGGSGGVFPSGTGTAGGACDCSTANYKSPLLSPTAPANPTIFTTNVNGTTYVQSRCINYTNPGDLKSYCPSALYTGPLPQDPGLKTVQVNVTWTINGVDYSVNVVSQVARL